MLMPVNDESLAREARDGNSSALEALVRRWQVPLVRFFERRVGSRSDAEDLFQETFLRVHQNLNSYDDRRRFKTWLFTIAWRLAANHLRDRKRPADDSAIERLADNAHGPQESAARSDLHHGLWGVARRVLTHDHYHLLWLCYVEELSAREIAHVTGRSWVAVKTALHRARRLLEPHVLQLQKDGVL